MKSLNLCVIFGGMSTEHDVSIVSGTSVIKNLDKTKYDIYPVYIDKTGKWYKYTKDIEEIEILNVGEQPQEVEEINNAIEYLKNMNIVFPVLHGLYGEDGTIQGLLELLKIPYVGCKVLGSSICMDKAYAKIVLEKANINQVKHVYIRKNKENYILVDEQMNEETLNINEISIKIEDKLGLPVFVKPSNSGSSVGINKAKNLEDLARSIEYAAQYDKKIIVEESINAKEVECAVLGNEEVEVACVGEILPADEFYTFDAKYNDEDSETLIPANISKEQSDIIRNIAKKAFKALDCKGLARVDFFIDKNSSKVYLNEVNTLPGFTNISMYPKLWENEGLKYSELLDKLINLAIE